MSNSAILEAESGDAGGAIRDMVRQSVTTALGRLYTFDQRARARTTPTGESAEAWQAYAELGLFGLGLDEEHGGFGPGLGDLAMVAELFGGAMVLEPYRPTMVAARLIAKAGSPEQKKAWLPRIVSGEVRAAIAFDRPGAPSPTVAASPDGPSWRLNGQAASVAGGDTADLVIIPAKFADGVGLFLVATEFVERRAYRCFDWTGAADLTLDDTPIPADGLIAGGADALMAATDEDTALGCADALGAIRAANLLVREHTRNRRQFGRSLDSFQVLQHRMVDMAIEEELASSLTKAAVAACDAARAEERMRAVSVAKVRLGDAARMVGEQCVQIHGGMGLVQEYPASQLFARLGQFELLHGDRDHHLQRYATLTL